VGSNGDRQLVEAYLRRLDVDAEPPSIDALFRIHRAHVDRVPYETTWIHLGERWSVDTDAAFERIASQGRGGYCFHLNGSLARLLTSLGYDVSLHIGGVHGPEPSEDDLTNHLVLTVAGLGTDDNPDGVWYVDAGLGDALYEPLPLIAGSYMQGPQTFALEGTPGGLGDWHFAHDPGGSFPGMNWRMAVATISDFGARHEVLSTSPDSSFVKTVTAQRRRHDCVLTLRALTCTRRGHDGAQTTFVTARDEWFELLAEEFLLTLDGVDDDAKDRLWTSACNSHELWLATQ
jgi:N-hydroxyarylamine O-acetyltransferase